MEKPYVISAELDLANIELGQIIKPENVDRFRENLDRDLRAMGKETLWVPSDVLKNGMECAINRTNLPVISLDDRYVTSAREYLGISRGVDASLEDVGYVARRNYRPVEEQLKQVANAGREVVLADDVLFSGEMVAWLADALKNYRVKIGAVIVGIAMREGIEKLAQEGIDVEAVEVFDEVEDEICERDFAVIPGSGRRVGELESSALYFDVDNGKPEKWASINAGYTKSFCVSSLVRSINLLQQNVPMQRLGNFVGYGSLGSGVDQIRKRIGELS